MRIVPKLILSIIAAMAVISCAKKEELDYSEFERASFEAWIKNNAPNATQLVEGIYYEVIYENPDTDAPKAESPKWIKVNYEVLDMEGNIVYTRLEDVAKRLDSYTKYTYYTPDYFPMPESSSKLNIMEAMYLALKEMKKGDIWRVYSTSDHVFSGRGVSNDIGYGGQYTLAASKPAIIDNLKIVDIIDDPDLYEQKQVEKIAFSRPPVGWELSDEDAVMKHYYRQYLARGDKDRDVVGVDSVVRIYYKAYFLDGFLFDTNIDSVWWNHYGLRRYDQANSEYKDDTTAIRLTRPKEFNISNIPSTKPNMSFYFLFAEEKEDMKVRYGDSLRVVLTSIYAYGDSGRTGYVSSQSSYDYSYSPYFYSYGGYGGYDYGGYGSYYNNPYYDMYSYYDTSSYYNSSTSSSVIYPRAEIKGFTPLIYELVIKRPVGKTGPDDEEEEGGEG